MINLDKLRLSIKGSLLVAVQIVAVADFQNVTVSLVEPDAILRFRIRTFTTFNATIDDVGDNPITGKATSLSVGG